jgi:4'-phosphopantetheinyl transferase
MAELFGEAAHLWWSPVDAAPSAEWLKRCAELLDPAETERWQRYRFAKDRNLFVIAHATLRRVLGAEMDVAPELLRFRQGVHGRPELVGPGAGRGLRFNLSHTLGMVVIVVAQGIDCGVDVEDCAREVAIESLARRQFAACEAADVLARSGADQRHKFFEYWTLKESYIKAIGLGLAAPLDRFSFAIEAAISIRFEAPLRDDAAAWQFRLTKLNKNYQVAVALRRGTGQDRFLRIRQLTFD